MTRSLLLALLALAPAGSTSAAPGGATPTSAAVAAAPASARPVSDIHLPFEIAVADLRRVVDAALAGGDPRGQLYVRAGIPIHPGTARVEVLRNGAVTLSARDDGVLLVSLPLRIKGRAEWETPDRIELKLGRFSRSFKVKPIRHHEDAEVTLTVHAALALDLTPEWTVRSRTQARFTWDERPTLSIGPISIDLGGVVGPSIDRLLAEAAPAVDAAIAREVRLRASIERAVQALARPLRLSDAPEAWLTVEPLAATFSGLARRGDRLIFSLGIKAHLAVLVGAAAPTRAPGALPPLGHEAWHQGSIQIEAEQRVTVAAVERAVIESLDRRAQDGAIPEVPFALATPPDFAMRAIGPRLEAAVNLTLALPGGPRTVRVRARAEANRGPVGAVALTITGVTLEWAERERQATPLEEAARVALGAGLDRLYRGTEVPLSTFTDPLRRTLQERLQALSIAPGVHLDATVDRVSVDAITIDGADLCFYLIVVGRASATLTPELLRAAG
ncbi:MAG: DUF4403 family protein [Nannocystaceae bacterium]